MAELKQRVEALKNTIESKMGSCYWDENYSAGSFYIEFNSVIKDLTEQNEALVSMAKEILPICRKYQVSFQQGGAEIDMARINTEIRTALKALGVEGY